MELLICEIGDWANSNFSLKESRLKFFLTWANADAEAELKFSMWWRFAETELQFTWGEYIGWGFRSLPEWIEWLKIIKKKKI